MKDSKMDLPKIGKLDFFEPDYQKFPALNFARQAMETGGTLPAVVNAADEIAVYSFLEGAISFPEIAEMIARTIDKYEYDEATSIDKVLDADTWARETALNIRR